MFVRLLGIESSRGGLALSSAFVLLEWCTLCLQTCADNKQAWDDQRSTLIVTTAILLELCSSSGRKAFRKSSVVITRRALRKLFGIANFGDYAIKAFVLQLSVKSQLGRKNAVLLGAVAGVCFRLSAKTEHVLQELESHYYTFWVREVIGSRSIVPQHIATAFDDFFCNFANLRNLQAELIPALEKALLRAPEIVLNDVVRPMIISLPSGIDLSEILTQNLVKPLLSNFKSTNVTIRNGALLTFMALIDHSYNPSLLERLTFDILSPLTNSKVASAEQRILCAKILGHLPFHPSISTSICDGLAIIATKELNEAAARAQATALSSHLVPCILQGSLNTAKARDAIARGLEDMRPLFRRLWANACGYLFWQISLRGTGSASEIQSVETILPRLLALCNELVSNPVNGIGSGILVAGYVTFSLYSFFASTVKDETIRSLLQRCKIVEMTLEVDSKAFLFNHRVYSKLEDISWLIRALASCFHIVCSSDAASTVSATWIQSFLYTIVASQVPSNIQEIALGALGKAYRDRPAYAGNLIIKGLWNWYEQVAANTKLSAAAEAQTGVKKLYLVIRAIFPGADQIRNFETTAIPQSLPAQLIGMLVLCDPEILPRTNWIETCIRVGQDPGALVSTHSQECVDHVIRTLDSWNDRTASAGVKSAAYRTLAELAFVAPSEITPILVKEIVLNLSPLKLSSFTQVDYAIAKSPEGTAFVDVLDDKARSKILDKGTKDYHTIKWEEELRSQLAQKNGHQRKLTAEEQAKVKTQLAQEASIRNEVVQVKGKIRRGLGIVLGLANGPPTQAEIWMGPSLKALLDIIKAGANNIVENDANKVYIACSKFVSPRLGTLRPFIGVATLRTLASSNLPEELSQEPLGELVTRVLYRLRITGEQRAYDDVSLAYVLPLLCMVLQNRDSGKADRDETSERVTLALEFLSFHTSAFSSSHLPRDEVLTIIIQSMQHYPQHSKLLKECLLELCRSIASNITVSETQTLLNGSILSDPLVRTAVLQAIRFFVDLTELDFVEQIWLSCHDDVEENAEIGRMIWEENALEAEAQNALGLIPYLSSSDKQLRRAASRALTQCVVKDIAIFPTVLNDLQEKYRELAKPRIPGKDDFGVQKNLDLTDPWEARSGIASALKHLAPIWPSTKVIPFIDFLINDNAIGDRNPSVRDGMIESATTVIALKGKEKLEEMMSRFENALDSSSDDSNVSDLVYEAVVILFGALARHLPNGDERVPKVVHRLLQILSTPSETVQYAVAKCLPPLVQSSRTDTPTYVQYALDSLFRSEKYAARRGAAYGLAGVVHGAGISGLREYRVMSSLKSAVENKKDIHYREGALFGYELLSLILGSTFEPYIIHIVPQMLSCFGDSSADVREACLTAAKTCFSSLSSFGVKLVLPTLLQGLEEAQWRTKKGACDLLGAMAYLDPRQLAQNLPEIVPPLTDVLNDSHKEVRAAANRSLQRFGEVISNPEVKSLISTILKALSDPTKYTDEALDALIKVSFVHYLDAPSLALIVHILERGLEDRSATKRKSAEIIGSLAHLTERKDLISHLPILVAGLKLAIIDPVPTTRATASKALGSLMEKLGEDALPDLIPGLMSTLKSETGASDRLGSSQALSEVLAGLGTSRLDETLPTILQNVASSKPTVREGFMSLFIFLPACFGSNFVSYLSRVIPSILTGLADDVESIRETSLRAGRLLVKNFATKAIDLLLPELERGLADNNYRIRLSSIELIGDLLFNLTGISGKTDQDEVEEGAAEAGQSLLEVLGEEKRNKILSSLYICRCDTSGLVRGAAINVWKALVATPRILKELLPTLTQLIIHRLASANTEQKVIAGNALGELIRKAGEGVLATLLPSLEEGLYASTDADTKQGICIALREIILSAAPEILEDYEKILISVVRAALVDSSDEVRDIAAEAFDSLQHIFGKRAVDQVLPHLLSLLRTESEATTALSALLTLLTDRTRSNIILPNLIPTLVASPISAFNAKAIASLAQVSSSGMIRKLPTILNALMDNIIVCTDDELRTDLESSFDSILLSVDEFDGLNTTMSVIMGLMKHDDHQRRSLVDTRLSKFFIASEIDFSRYHPDLIRVLLFSFDDRDPEVVRSAWTALSQLMHRLKKEEMESLVISTRQVLQQVGVPGLNLPGFSLPKGINAILPIFLQGLMNGTADQRIQSALALSEIIERTNSDALKPFVTNITGPLIRVVSERSVELKCTF